MRTILKIIGFLFGVLNALPIPWRLRVLWMRFLYFFISFSTNLFPSILHWTKKQNIKYKMGKQEGEDYESLVELERVLQFFETAGVPIQRITQAVDRAALEAVPPEEMGSFLARAVLEPDEANRILKTALEAGRY